MKKHFDILIKGNLRNTGFVLLILKKARNLNVTGKAGYHGDGDVLIQAEGNTEQLDRLLEYCRKNPAGDPYKEINILEGVLENYSDFEMNVT
nr:acylphosphatase [Bacteroidota bacterium]